MKNGEQTDLASEIIQDYEKLAGERGNLDSHCKEIAERIIPSHSFLFTNKGMNQTQGEKRNHELFDSTGANALNRFGAILDSLLTPRNGTWHKISLSNRDLWKMKEVRLFYEEVNRLLFKHRYAPKANFAGQNQLNYKSLGAYGTGALFTDELQGDSGLRYKNIHLSEVYLKENHQGIVDSVLRYFPMTARQAMQKWGERCPDKIKKATNTNQLFNFIHCVRPREDVDFERKDYKGMPYASYYISVDGKHFLSEGGYNTFPYAISRYEQAPGEVYGRSPAMDVLPAIKTLNEQKKTMLKQGHRAVDPILLVHDDGIADSFSFKPGALNAGGVSAEGRALVHALPTGSIAAGKDMMDEERAIINDAFLVTLFQILADTPQMSATEVLERTREKGILLAPTVGRQQDEYLGPLIERELDLLAQQGLLPPMPQVLIEAKGEYDVEYDSPLSRAQRAEEGSGLMRTVEHALSVVNVTQNPEPLDFFNWDTIIPEIAQINAVPERWMRSMEQVQQMRMGRQQQAEQQQMIQAAPAAAAMTKAVAVATKRK